MEWGGGEGWSGEEGRGWRMRCGRVSLNKGTRRRGRKGMDGMGSMEIGGDGVVREVIRTYTVW